MNNQPILISDRRVVRIPIKDNGESLVDLRDLRWLYVDERKSKTSESFSKVRESIADKLQYASLFLPAGIRFLVIEGHRPLSLQTKYFNRYCNKLRAKHPEWNPNTLDAETSKFVAPAESVPPHLTGGAIDLTLARADGHELDMGTDIDADPEATNNASYMDAKNISEMARTNREILRSALSRSGLVNYPTEWWHWSYGDRYWAFMTDHQFAIYGTIRSGIGDSTDGCERCVA